jgi:hypothetical protein
MESSSRGRLEKLFIQYSKLYNIGRGWRKGFGKLMVMPNFIAEKRE